MEVSVKDWLRTTLQRWVDENTEKSQQVFLRNVSRMGFERTISVYKRAALAALLQCKDEVGQSRAVRIGHFGCGHDSRGMTTLFTERELHGVNMIGVDVDMQTLSLYPECKLQASLEAVPLPDRAFDLVLAEFVLEHIEKPERVFQEIARVLEKGAVFIFITPNKWSPYALVARSTPYSLHKALVALLLGSRKADVFPTYYRANSRRKLLQLLQCHFSSDLQMLEPLHRFVFAISPLATRILVEYYVLLHRFHTFDFLRTQILGICVRE